MQSCVRCRLHGEALELALQGNQTKRISIAKLDVSADTVARTAIDFHRQSLEKAHWNLNCTKPEQPSSAPAVIRVGQRQELYVYLAVVCVCGLYVADDVSDRLPVVYPKMIGKKSSW